MIYVWYALKSIITKSLQNCFFFRFFNICFCGYRSRIVVDFCWNSYVCDSQKAKQVHAMTDTKDNSSTDFSKNFFNNFQKKCKKFIHVAQKYFLSSCVLGKNILMGLK